MTATTQWDPNKGDRPLNCQDIANAVTQNPVNINFPGNVAFSGQSIGLSGNVSASGGNQTTAPLLAAGTNFLTGATSATAGATLPAGTVGAVRVINATGNVSVVYAPLGNGTISGGSANGNIAIGAGNATTFYPQSALAYWAEPKTPS